MHFEFVKHNECRWCRDKITKVHVIESFIQKSNVNSPSVKGTTFAVTAAARSASSAAAIFPASGLSSMTELM